MYYMHAFYYHHYLLDYVLHALSAPHALLQTAQENIKRVLGPPPPCSFPMASRKRTRIHCRRGAYQRHFHQIKLANRRHRLLKAACSLNNEVTNSRNCDI